jgi:hypothetical protein
MSIAVVCEGDTDLPVLRALVEDAGMVITDELDMAGKHPLDSMLSGFNDAAKGSPWLVIRDLDYDASCAPSYLAEIAFRPSLWMCFRLAVREIEAWLIADRRAFAEYLKVPLTRIPLDPDAERDPTRTIVDLAQRSTSASIRNRIVPKPGYRTQVGRQYETCLIDFAVNHWSLERACKNSESLRRARRAVRALGERWRKFAAGEAE